MSILTIEWLHLLARLTKPFANSVIYLQIKFLNPLITRKPKLRRQRKIFRQQGEIFWYPMTLSHASCSTLTIINVWRNTLTFFTTRQNAETWPDEHKCGYMGKVLYNATSFFAIEISLSIWWLFEMEPLCRRLLKKNINLKNVSDQARSENEQNSGRKHINIHPDISLGCNFGYWKLCM